MTSIFIRILHYLLILCLYLLSYLISLRMSVDCFWWKGIHYDFDLILISYWSSSLVWNYLVIRIYIISWINYQHYKTLRQKLPWKTKPNISIRFRIKGPIVQKDHVHRRSGKLSSTIQQGIMRLMHMFTRHINHVGTSVSYQSSHSLYT